MNVRFFEAAQRDLDDAVAYYNSESTGLGDEFLLEVLRALDRIRDHPDAWQQFSREARRCLMRRFPYGILYQVIKRFW